MTYVEKYGKIIHMIIEYTRHAKRRLKWRKISVTDVELAVISPDELESSGKYRINVYKTISGRILKVTYQKYDNRIQVITALWKGE